jgi:hypothetical protein
MPYREMGIEAFYWINGQLYLIVNPPFLLTLNTASVQLGFTPMPDTLLFITAATTFLLSIAFFTIFKSSGLSLT